MILFTILALMALMLIGVVIAAVASAGAAFILVFADVIVCIAIIIPILKFLVKRENRFGSFRFIF